MAYTKEEIINMKLDLLDARNKIVDLRLFDYIDDIKLEDETLSKMDYSTSLYKEYIDMLNTFNEVHKDRILKNLMNTEIIDNHKLEKAGINLLKEESKTYYGSAIKYISKKIIIENNDINDYIIKKTHEILLRRTTDENTKVSNYRKNNNHFVGYKENNNNYLWFLPISYDDIKSAMSLFINYYNSNNNEFYKPFIIHGLISCMQAFEDGNTRLARTLSYVNLLEITNNVLNTNNESTPLLYYSNAIIPFRYEYRSLIRDLAINPNNDNWNKWIKFNLNRMEDQIYNNLNNLELIRYK